MAGPGASQGSQRVAEPGEEIGGKGELDPEDINPGREIGRKPAGELDRVLLGRDRGFGAGSGDLGGDPLEGAAGIKVVIGESEGRDRLGSELTKRGGEAFRAGDAGHGADALPGQEAGRNRRVGVQRRRLAGLIPYSKMGREGNRLSVGRQLFRRRPFPEEHVGPAESGQAFPERLGRSGVVKDDLQVPAQLEMLEAVVEDGEIEPGRLSLEAGEVAVFPDEDPARGTRRAIIAGSSPASRQVARTEHPSDNTPPFSSQEPR